MVCVCVFNRLLEPIHSNARITRPWSATSSNKTRPMTACMQPPRPASAIADRTHLKFAQDAQTQADAQQTDRDTDTQSYDQDINLFENLESRRRKECLKVGSRGHKQQQNHTFSEDEKGRGIHSKMKPDEPELTTFSSPLSQDSHTQSGRENEKEKSCELAHSICPSTHLCSSTTNTQTHARSYPKDAATRLGQTQVKMKNDRKSMNCVLCR